MNSDLLFLQLLLLLSRPLLCLLSPLPPLLLLCSDLLFGACRTRRTLTLLETSEERLNPDEEQDSPPGAPLGGLLGSGWTSLTCFRHFLSKEGVCEVHVCGKLFLARLLLLLLLTNEPRGEGGAGAWSDGLLISSPASSGPSSASSSPSSSAETPPRASAAAAAPASSSPAAPWSPSALEDEATVTPEARPVSRSRCACTWYPGDLHLQVLLLPELLLPLLLPEASEQLPVLAHLLLALLLFARPTCSSRSGVRGPFPRRQLAAALPRRPLPSGCSGRSSSSLEEAR